MKTLDDFFSPRSHESKITVNSIHSSTSATAVSLSVTKDIRSLTEVSLKDENKPQAGDSNSVEAKGDNDNRQGGDMEDEVKMLEDKG